MLSLALDASVRLLPSQGYHTDFTGYSQNYPQAMPEQATFNSVNKK